MSKKKTDKTGNIIAPYNPKKYNLEKALTMFPYIEWNQHARPELYGSVYLYVGEAGGDEMGQQLAYEFEVIETDVDASFDDSCCYYNPKVFSQNGKFIRMKFVRRIPQGLITLDDLLANGLTKHPQSQMKVPFKLQKFINTVLK